jgi:hypothetical protein
MSFAVYNCSQDAVPRESSTLLLWTFFGQLEWYGGDNKHVGRKKKKHVLQNKTGHPLTKRRKWAQKSTCVSFLNPLTKTSAIFNSSLSRKQSKFVKRGFWSILF